MKIFQATILFLLIALTLACSASQTTATSDSIAYPAPHQSPTPSSSMIDEFVRKEWNIRYEQMKAEILAAQTVWNENGPRTYTFVAEKQRAGHTSVWNRSPVRISVVNGESVSTVLVDPSSKVNHARTDGFEVFNTIDKLFVYMLSELENGYLVRGKYDSRLGYPKIVSIVEFLGPHGGRSIDITEFKS